MIGEDSKRKEIGVLILLVVILFFVNYSYLDSKVEAFFSDDVCGSVERVVDGDTLKFNSSSVRLLGINCPEKGERFYSEAKGFLEEFVLNESVCLVGADIDKYGRRLSYVFVDSVNVNLELVRNGYANFYFPSGKDIYYDDFVEAWEECLSDGVNLCERSDEVCSFCVSLNSLDVESQEFVLVNDCLYDCDLTGWSVKDEGRKKFVFPDFVLESGNRISVGVDSGDFIWEGEDYVWTDTGDSLFLRDSKEGLVLFYSY